MTDTTTLLQQAVSALEEATTYTSSSTWSPSMTDDCNKVIAAIRAHLAQPPAHHDLAHELWAAAQLAPGEGIADGVGRIAAILAAQPAPDAPGYVLVPVDPHDDMLIAGQEAWAVIKPLRNAIEDCKEADAVYRAMIKAAPGATK